MTDLLPFESSVPDPAPRAATAEAITRVEHHADPSWLERAYQTLCQIARQQAEITADDVWDALRGEALSIVPHELRAIGPVFRRAAKDGIIGATDRIKLSALGGGRWKVRVWTSRTFQGKRE